MKMLQDQKINMGEDGTEMSLSFLPLELQQKFPFFYITEDITAIQGVNS